MALRRTYRMTLAVVAMLGTAACVPQDNAPRAASAAAGDLVFVLVSSGPRLRARMVGWEDSALGCGWVPG